MKQANSEKLHTVLFHVYNIFKIYFDFVFIGVWPWVSVPWELESQTVASPTRALGIEPGSSGEQSVLLTAEPSLQPV